MSQTLKGKANHVYDDNSINTIDVNVIEYDKPEQGRPFISLSNGDSSIIINGREQWKQLNAIVLDALTYIEIEED